MIQELTPEELKEKLDQKIDIFLKLYKPGCGACKMSEPAVTRLMEKHGKNFEFGEIDVEEYPEILDLAQGEAVPIFILFKNQKITGKVIGFKGIQKLENLFQTP
jgi:thioredoxin 1